MLFASILVVKADTNIETNNEQLINYLKQLIMLLMQQIAIKYNSVTPPVNTNFNATSTSQLQIVSDYVDPKTTSAVLEWYTNQLTESKVYLSGGKLEDVILTSEAGLANHHVIHIYNLDPATIYSYKIVAIKDNTTALKTGEFKTYPLAVPLFYLKVLRYDSALFNDDNTFHYYAIIQLTSPEGSPYTGIKVKINEKEYTTDNQGTILYRLKGKPEYGCRTNLILHVLTDTIENKWVSYELPIEGDCENAPPTTPPCRMCLMHNNYV